MLNQIAFSFSLLLYLIISHALSQGHHVFELVGKKASRTEFDDLLSPARAVHRLDPLRYVGVQKPLRVDPL